MDSKKEKKAWSATHSLTYDLSINFFLETYWNLRASRLIPEVAKNFRR